MTTSRQLESTRRRVSTGPTSSRIEKRDYGFIQEAYKTPFSECLFSTITAQPTRPPDLGSRSRGRYDDSAVLSGSITHAVIDEGVAPGVPGRAQRGRIRQRRTTSAMLPPARPLNPPYQFVGRIPQTDLIMAPIEPRDVAAVDITGVRVMPEALEI